jgi:hypothetical protein
MTICNMERIGFISCQSLGKPIMLIYFDYESTWQLILSIFIVSQTESEYPILSDDYHISESDTLI